ncbi:MAG: HDOD domain-containing protein [Acidobacteria bacterium]|nr:HDOD domain-containing protein [Acidobacteriota bacterium]
MMIRELTAYPTGKAIAPSPIDVDSLVRLKLPPLNGTVARISELLRDPNISSRKLAEAVGYDPILAARLLKMANSSLYARKKATTSIERAIEAIGLKALYDVVMLGAMADGFAREIGTMVYGRIIWEHSIVVALLSRTISDLLNLRGTEEAFLCGLLHDIGKILLLKAEPEKFVGLLENKPEAEMLRDEEYVFGLTHAEIGAYVTHKWQLPDVVCCAIMHHHNPCNATVSTVITHIIAVADLVANINGYGLRLDEENALFDSRSVSFLNLSSAQISLAWENIQEPFQEVVKTFA